MLRHTGSESPLEADALLAQHKTVTIVPLCRIGRLSLVEGAFGEFDPLVPADVPLYVALLLKSSSLCTIRPPEWLSVAHLAGVLDREIEVEDEYQPLDMYIFENAEIYLAHCDTVESITELRLLLKKIREARLAKTLRGCEAVDSRVINISNMTFYEFRQIKEYLLPHMQMQRQIGRSLDRL